ncbi:unnamed protein product [Effrenium voratum]|uniref:Oxidoreductase NAD-binding domain-containing protein 1 n=1 Tax=Effrenium voratum TaxID=2562239 RepID=A0AA36HM61_9DINO|nr:unnamed protein product [Effrenium voratum]
MVGFLDRLRKDTDARRPFCIELSELQAALGFASHRQLVEFAILCGCDYTGRLPGVGPHKAHRIISEYKSIGRFRICKEGRAISKEAWANFKYKETRTLFEKKLVAALKPADRLKRRLVTGSPETKTSDDEAQRHGPAAASVTGPGNRMGPRQAELGPSWCPSGLVSRQLTEALAAPKGKLPLRLREAQARANAEPGAQRDEWNATDQVSNILKPAQLVFASTKANRVPMKVKAAQAGWLLMYMSPEAAVHHTLLMFSHQLWGFGVRQLSREVRQLTPSIKELTLHAPGLRFKAGNWVDFFIDQDGVDRVGGYSMSSVPAELPTLRLAVKASRHPPAAWCHDKAQPGKWVKLKAGGSFFFDPKQYGSHLQQLVFIAGGIGINPIFSMVQETLLHTKLRVALLYSASEEKELAYQAELELLRDRHPQMHLELRVTRNADWEGARGRLTGQHILEHVEDVNSAEIFLCGPPAMTDELVKQLEPISLKLHYERWRFISLSIVLEAGGIPLLSHESKQSFSKKPAAAVLGFVSRKLPGLPPAESQDMPKAYAWTTPRCSTPRRQGQGRPSDSREMTMPKETSLPSGGLGGAAEGSEAPQSGAAPLTARERYAPKKELLFRPCSAAKPRINSSTCWRPNEHSLQRNSFNSIVSKEPLDVTEVMLRNASMGRQAASRSWGQTGVQVASHHGGRKPSVGCDVPTLQSPGWSRMEADYGRYFLSNYRSAWLHDEVVRLDVLEESTGRSQEAGDTSPEAARATARDEEPEGPPVTLPPTQPPTQPPTAPRTVDETPDAPEASPVEVDGARSANVDFDELQRKLQQLACGTREDSKAKRTAVEDTPSPEKQIRFSESETAAEPEQHTTQQGRRFPALPHAAAVREPREDSGELKRNAFLDEVQRNSAGRESRLRQAPLRPIPEPAADISVVEMDEEVTRHLEAFFSDEDVWQKLKQDVLGDVSSELTQKIHHLPVVANASKFKVTVPKPYPGVQYRRSKHLEERYSRYAENGAIVVGQVGIRRTIPWVSSSSIRM